MEARDAVDAVAVGEGEGAMAEFGGALGEILGVRSALEKGEGTAAAQLDEVFGGRGRAHHLSFAFCSP